MTKTAKPCPFCDGPAISNEYDEVWCDRDDCLDDVKPLNDWNQRPAEDRLRAALAHMVYLSRGRFPGIRPAIDSIIVLRGLDLDALTEMGPKHCIDPESLTKPENG